MNAMIICGVAAMMRSLKHAATSLHVIINTLIAYSFAAWLCLLKRTATSLSAIIRYDNMRRCRNDAFIETCCDKLACYNFAMIICGVAAMMRSLKHAATSLHVIINTLIAYSFAAWLCLLKRTATSLSAIIRYDNMRRCRKAVFMKRTAVNLSAIYI